MYTIYIHINKLNKKAYVGMTKQMPKIRWAKGEGYKSQSYFYTDICKYGWENFEHILLAQVPSYEKADELEAYFIAYYDTTNPDKGYNQQKGTGELAEATLLRRAQSSTRSTYYQYDLHYNLINTWYSGLELKKAGYSMPSIYACCANKIQTYKNYIWSTTPLEHPALIHNNFINQLYTNWLNAQDS